MNRREDGWKLIATVTAIVIYVDIIRVVIAIVIVVVSMAAIDRRARKSQGYSCRRTKPAADIRATTTTTTTATGNCTCTCALTSQGINAISSHRTKQGACPGIVDVNPVAAKQRDI